MHFSLAAAYLIKARRSEISGASTSAAGADRRLAALCRCLAIRESAKTTPWPPRPTYASGPARQAAAA